MTTDPMARAREMLAAEYARNEMDGEAAYLREGSTASLDERCAVNVIAALLTREAEVRGEERKGFAPCPTCHQYSHSISEDRITEAFNHFQSMFSHRGDGIPTQFTFDDRTRDAAQVLMAAIRDGAPGGDGWQSMETAPIDPIVQNHASDFAPNCHGPEVLLYFPDLNDDVSVGWWSYADNCWRSVSDDGPNDVQPTAWRPLPAPPSLRASGHEGGGE